jgi:hypothetical protein
MSADARLCVAGDQMSPLRRGINDIVRLLPSLLFEARMESKCLNIDEFTDSAVRPSSRVPQVRTSVETRTQSAFRKFCRRLSLP